jgi:hypothetical protein
MPNSKAAAAARSASPPPAHLTHVQLDALRFKLHGVAEATMITFQAEEFSTADIGKT